MELWKRRILTNEDISRIVVRESFPPSDGAAINFELFSLFFFSLLRGRDEEALFLNWFGQFQNEPKVRNEPSYLIGRAHFLPEDICVYFVTDI